MRIGLADALDLMMSCTEAGLSLDKTMARVSNDLRLVHHGTDATRGDRGTLGFQKTVACGTDEWERGRGLEAAV